MVAIAYCVILYHGTARFLVPFDRNSSVSVCEDLLSSGAFKKASANSTNDFFDWHPDGCSLKHYSQEQSKACMQQIRHKKGGILANIIFTGDSRVRQLRDGLLYQLSGFDQDWLANRNVTLNPRRYKKHSSNEMLLKTTGVRLEFNFAEALDAGDGVTGKSLKEIIRKSRIRQPDLLVVGNGAWTIRECTAKRRLQSQCAEDYKKAFLALLPLLTEIGRKTPVLWAPQIMVNESNMWDREFTNQNMEMYNAAVRSALGSVPGNRVVYWHSLEAVSRIFNDSFDGLHLGPRAKYCDVQFLLNLLCNALTEDGKRPTRDYCCTKRNLLRRRHLFRLQFLCLFLPVSFSLSLLLGVLWKRSGSLKFS
ncbi:hypothetical protein BV898_13986 [Hypsibius exemplaris]|uniref:CAS1 domain-containing protein 1 n=1 Tax=Hypsibius exemplaris TaxID=2072580 RepID=A0A1W0W930_HYPEX|nr:hypothetical protein BV898_13986 [Hypsibius exemplaris]